MFVVLRAVSGLFTLSCDVFLFIPRDMMGKVALSDILWDFRGQQGPSISCYCRAAGEACKAPWKLMGSSKGNLKVVEIWVKSPGLALGIVSVTGEGCTRCVAVHLTQVKITGRVHNWIFSHALF